MTQVVLIVRPLHGQPAVHAVLNDGEAIPSHMSATSRVVTVDAACGYEPGALLNAADVIEDRTASYRSSPVIGPGPDECSVIRLAP